MPSNIPTWQNARPLVLDDVDDDDDDEDDEDRPHHDPHHREPGCGNITNNVLEMEKKKKIKTQMIEQVYEFLIEIVTYIVVILM